MSRRLFRLFSASQVVGLLAAAILTFTSVSAFAERRVALVIGNSAYQYAPQLTNPKNDATDMSVKLRAMGFDVTQGVDLNLVELRSTVREFVSKVSGADLALFFYAGHGLQVNGVNYVAPVDVRLQGYEDLEFETLSMDVILSAMERNAKVNLIFLDACRDNPFNAALARSMGTRSSAVGRGLARLGSGVGTLIAFATQPGNVALDGSGRNSPFTAALLKHLGTPGQGVTQDLILARQEVLASTDGKQVPWDNSSLTGDVILVPAAEPQNGQALSTSAPPTSSDSAAVDLAYWDSIKNEKSVNYYQSYLSRFPNGTFADLARLRIAEFSTPKIGGDSRVENQRTAGIQPGQVTDGSSCSRGQTPDNQGRCKPIASGLAVFDGYWTLTRIAKSAKVCVWKQITSSVTIANGRIHSSNFSGTVSESGKVEIKHTFIYNGKQGSNRLTGRITDGKGTGRFYQPDGDCKGLFVLSR